MFKKCLIKFYNYLSIGFSIILLLSCVYNYVNATHIIYILEIYNSSTSTVVWALFPRAVAIACMISRCTVMYKNINDIILYEKKVKEYELYFPVNVCQNNYRCFFLIIIVTFCVVVILPVNIYRVCSLYYQYKNSKITILFLLMYVQNLSMCMTELKFVGHCFGLYQKFKLINEEMSVLKTKTILLNKYPLILKPEEHCNTHCIELEPNGDIFWKIKVHSLMNKIELLKMRHQFVSDAVKNLNELYGIQLGLSLCILFIMSLFDIYDVVSGDYNITSSNMLLYGWLMQYSFRFCMIVLISHTTTKQVGNCR